MMKLLKVPVYWRYWIYPLVVIWLLWLYVFSNVFTMGYSSPVSKKFAISVVGLLLPFALALTRSSDGWIVAGLLAFVTWPPIILLLAVLP
jgi:hypothetical protein